MSNEETDLDFVDLGDVCRQKLGMQCQYGSRYADSHWHPEWKFCGENLRITGSSRNYHFMKIHKDDVEEFVKRVIEARSARSVR